MCRSYLNYDSQNIFTASFNLNLKVTFINVKLKGRVLKLFFYCLKSPRATDINPIAAQCTSQTAKQNGVNVCCVVTDLVSYNLSNVILMELYSKNKILLRQISKIF